MIDLAGVSDGSDLFLGLVHSRMTVMWEKMAVAPNPENMYLAPSVLDLQVSTISFGPTDDSWGSSASPRRETDEREDHHFHETKKRRAIGK